MPDVGVIDSSVLFFVKVALEVFILENDMYIFSFPLILFYFACHARRHLTHHVMKPFLLEARRA
jgi:hypothetical protein